MSERRPEIEIKSPEKQLYSPKSEKQKSIDWISATLKKGLFSSILRAFENVFKVATK